MLELSKKLILLDRDGVLNVDRPDYVNTPDELVLLPGVSEALARLKLAGFRIGVCTNQAGIARGRYDVAMLAAIHARLQVAVSRAIDCIEFCSALDDAHPDRKPNPGMLLKQAAFFAVDLVGVPFVGDSMTDVRAAWAAGAEPVLVRTGKGAAVEREFATELAGVAVFDDLFCAVEAWLDDEV